MKCEELHKTTQNDYAEMDEKQLSALLLLMSRIRAQCAVFSEQPKMYHY